MDGTGAPNDGEIKMVMAVIRPDKFSDVKTALAGTGAPLLTVTNVFSRGSQPAKKSRWHGGEYTIDLHRKVRIECVIAGTLADDVVDAIIGAVQADERGDRKVFTLPVESVMQVRTGKTGRDAV